MALSCGFFNSLNGDRKYDAVQMSSIFDGIILDGIFQAIDDAFAVTVSEDGSGIVVGAGRAWFDHTWTRNDAPYPLTLEQSEVALDRIDAVVLEVDSSSAVRNNTIKIVKGTPSSSPKKPSLTNNETLHQYPLAYLTRPAGVETIAQAQIESVIGTSECPFVTGPLQVITTDSMLAQWQDEFDTWFESLEDTLSGDVAANLANQIMQKVDKSSVLDTTEEIEAVTEEGYVAGALVAKELISKLPVTITRLDDGPTDYTYDCCYYPAVGMCVLQLSVNPRVSKTYENGTTYSLYEIAEGYRPSRSAALYCYSSGSAVSNAAINSAGTIRYQPKVSDVQPSQPITISGAWFVD